MSIQFDNVNQVFHLKAGSMSYVMQIRNNKDLEHLYWGKAVKGSHLDYISEGRGNSYDTLPMEYPSYGSYDFRIPAFSIQLENGSTVTELAYSNHRIYKGKPVLEGLPATYVENENEAETLEIDLIDSLTNLKIILSYTTYEDYNVITRNARLINEGAGDLKILSALSMCVDYEKGNYEMLQLSGAWGREREIYKRKVIRGMQSIESRRGSSSHQQNPFLALMEEGATEDYGNVFGFNLVYSGSFVAGAEVDQFDSTRVFMGINSFDFSWLLKPGEAFQTPEAVLVFSGEGIGGMSREYHRLYRTRLCRGVYRDKKRPILVNNWEGTYFDFTADKIVDIAKVGSELGIELMVLDDGWFGKRNDDTCSLGDWYVNKEKLPLGLRDLSERVNRTGLKFGLWFEPEMISPDSDLYRAHPDWCIHVPGRNRTQARNQLVLDFTRDDVRDAIAGMLSDILSNNPISYVKWDFNRYLSEIGSALLPAERQREASHRFTLGVYQVMDKLTSAFPEVLFEGCASGGGRFDPGMLYYMPQIWTSDNTDAVERLKIQYGTSIVYPVSSMGAHVSASPNHQVHRFTSLRTRGDVAMSGNFGYELDLTVLTPEEKEEVKIQVAEYKELSSLIQQGDMYRIMSPFDSNETAWMFVSSDKKEAFVQYFRVLSKPNSSYGRIRLKGLNPDYEYQIIGQYKSYEGDVLMNIGLPAPSLEGDFQSYTWKLKVLES